MYIYIYMIYIYLSSILAYTSKRTALPPLSSVISPKLSKAFRPLYHRRGLDNYSRVFGVIIYPKP